MKTFYFFILVLLAIGFSSCDKDKEPEPLRVPKAISITGIDLLKYPASKLSGSGWDLSTGPDIFMTLTAGSLAQNGDKITNTYNDASPNGIISFMLSNSVTINDLSSIWTIGAYDSDSFDPDDFIAGGGFVPNDHADTMPNDLTLTTADGSFSVRLYLTWNF